jgi:adenylate kinase
MRLVLLGPPGSGKGTHAALLSERVGVSVFSCGDLLRDATQRGDPQGKEADGFMKRGVLVPDRLVTELILKRLEALGAEETFLLDGFPRTQVQAEALDDCLKRLKQAAIDLAVDFEMSEAKVISRLAGRRVCSQCRTIFHMETLLPRQAGVCDRCGGKLQSREDDDPETIRKRLAVYHKESQPLLDFYQVQGKLRNLSGELAVEEQYQALFGLLKQERLAE